MQCYQKGNFITGAAEGTTPSGSALPCTPPPTAGRWPEMLPRLRLQSSLETGLQQENYRSLNYAVDHALDNVESHSSELLLLYREHQPFHKFQGYGTKVPSRNVTVAHLNLFDFSATIAIAPRHKLRVTCASQACVICLLVYNIVSQLHDIDAINHQLTASSIFSPSAIWHRRTRSP